MYFSHCFCFTYISSFFLKKSNALANAQALLELWVQ